MIMVQAMTQVRVGILDQTQAGVQATRQALIQVQAHQTGSMTRLELVKLRDCGILSEREFIEQLVLEPGDTVDPKYWGKPLTEYIESVKNEMIKFFHLPTNTYDQLAQEYIKVEDDAATITLKIKPPVGVQWLNLGITIERREDS
jgi:hypothetical protein